MDEKDKRIAELEREKAEAYEQGRADGWNFAMDFFDKFNRPADTAFQAVNMLIGVVLGIGVGGIGKMPKEMLKTLSNVFAYLINDADQSNRRLAQELKETLGRDVPLMFDIQPAYDTNEAMKAFYSGEDNGQKLIVELQASPAMQALLRVRRQMKDRVDPIDGALDELLIKLRPYHDNYQETAKTIMRVLGKTEIEGSLNELQKGILNRLKNEDSLKMGNYKHLGEWGRTRAKRARKRVTSL